LRFSGEIPVTGAVKPPIIPAGREYCSTRLEIKGGWKEERGLGTGRLDMTDFQVISRDGQEKRKFCIELG